MSGKINIHTYIHSICPVENSKINVSIALSFFTSPNYLNHCPESLIQTFNPMSYLRTVIYIEWSINNSPRCQQACNVSDSIFRFLPLPTVEQHSMWLPPAHDSHFRCWVQCIGCHYNWTNLWRRIYQYELGFIYRHPVTNCCCEDIVMFALPRESVQHFEHSIKRPTDCKWPKQFRAHPVMKERAWWWWAGNEQ